MSSAHVSAGELGSNHADTDVNRFHMASQGNVTVINIVKQNQQISGDNSVKSYADNFQDLQTDNKNLSLTNGDSGILDSVKRQRSHLFDGVPQDNMLSSNGISVLSQEQVLSQSVVEKDQSKGKVNDRSSVQTSSHSKSSIDDKVIISSTDHYNRRYNSLSEDTSNVNMNDKTHRFSHALSDKKSKVVEQYSCVDHSSEGCDSMNSEPERDQASCQIPWDIKSEADCKREHLSEDSVFGEVDSCKNVCTAMLAADDGSATVVRRTKSQKHSLAENVSDDSSDEDIGVYAESFRYSNWVRLEAKSKMKIAGVHSLSPLRSSAASSLDSSSADITEAEAPPLSPTDEADDVFSDSFPQITSNTRSPVKEFTHHYMSRRKCLIQRADSQQEYHRLSARIYDQDRQVIVERISDNDDLGLHLLDSYPAFITSVDPGSAAERAGIKEGQILVSVNNQNVLTTDHADIVKLIQNLKGNVELGVANSDFQPVRDLQASIMSGFMSKLGNNTFKRWQRRYFVLRQDYCLYYYRNEQETDPLGAIPLSGYTISRHSEAGKDCCFKAEKFGGRTYYFVADSRDQMTAWVGALSEASICSKKRNESFLSVSSQNVGLPALHILKPECAGFLGKLSPSGRLWRRRYCVLKDACVYYYKDKNSVSALGVAHLHGYTLNVENYPRRKCSFTLQPPEKNMRVFAFSADNETDKKRWVESLNDSIQRWVQADKKTE